jgi:hypothetical protein
MFVHVHTYHTASDQKVYENESSKSGPQKFPECKRIILWIEPSEILFLLYDKIFCLNFSVRWRCLTVERKI